MGDGRAQPGQTQIRARRDRRAGRYALIVADAGDPASLQSHGRPDPIGDHHGRPLSALRHRTDRGMRRLRHRLFRSLRRAALDAADDRRAPGDGANAAARGSCSPAAINSLPFELGVFFVQEEAKRVFGAPAARVKGRVRAHARYVLGRHGGERPGDLRGGREGSQSVCASLRSVRADAGIFGAKTAARQQAGLRRGPEDLVRRRSSWPTSTRAMCTAPTC